MEILQKLIEQAGMLHLTWQNAVMFLVGGILIFLACLLYTSDAADE